MLDEALHQIGWAEWQAELKSRHDKRELVGAGLGSLGEKSGLGPFDNVKISVDVNGAVQIITGTASVGQGVETVVAQGCADLFQRSSSCVEGRNGHLSRYHQGCHRLSDRKLAALTAIHNSPIRRPDGTTAAERFFGRAHPLLVEQVLGQISFPPPPRRQRPCRAKRPYLMPLAA